MAAAQSNNGGWKREQLWSHALHVAVMREVKKGEPTRRLQALAEKVVKMALKGDAMMIKEIGDRLDGKPRQQIEHGGEGGGPFKIEVVKFANS